MWEGENLIKGEHVRRGAEEEKDGCEGEKREYKRRGLREREKGGGEAKNENVEKEGEERGIGEKRKD